MSYYVKKICYGCRLSCKNMKLCFVRNAKHFKMVPLGAATLVSKSAVSLSSPWFVVPGSDRILLTKNKNTQYFPPQHIVESDTSALWTKTSHRLLNRSPKWKGEEVSWKRRLKSSQYPHSEGHSGIHRSSYLFISQPSRTPPCGDGVSSQPLRTKPPRRAS